MVSQQLPSKTVMFLSFFPVFCPFLSVWEVWWRGALVSPDGVVPSRMVTVSASVNLPLHHKVQKSGASSPGWSRKKSRKTVVVWCFVCFSSPN